MTTQLPLTLFWGKTPAVDEPINRYHPAIHHMIDVGCVAEALLCDGPPRLRTALIRAFAGCDTDLLIEWLPMLVATHDLGKISAAFQGQQKSKSTLCQRERLTAQGVVFKPTTIKDLYHAEISAVWIDRNLAKAEDGTPLRFVWAIRDAMGGHHGQFAERGVSAIEKRIRETEGIGPNGTAWDVRRKDAYDLLRQLFTPKDNLKDVDTPRRLRAASALLTGFIIWCDWMGSNSIDFVAAPEIPPEDYIHRSRGIARRALDTYGMDIRRPLATYTGYSALFEGDKPRPLQEKIDSFPDDMFTTPALIVIEAPTGEGKTEAALALARRFASGMGADETFFALPTMASGNQMFMRLESFYNRVSGASVRLTHSQALVTEDDLRRALQSDDSAGDVADASSAKNALQWFTGPKKAVLAPFGVGTVDQVELAALNIRHYMLKLVGFANKVIVIDEVHAYDSYMNTILDHALEWLAALGCPVILLSATLPTMRHRALAEHYLKGLQSDLSADLPENPSYPLISMYRSGGQDHYASNTFREQQTFTMRLMISPEDIRAEAQHLIDLVSDGGAVARLCNRVDDAQALYENVLDLLPHLDGYTQHVLLHARFPLDDRKEREQKISGLVGKESSRTEHDRIIIIGTQVLEQSLDFDVDVMITDFAPVDLLLQRAGRLHRHERPRPARHQSAVLEVRVPPFISGMMPNFKRWEAIYASYILQKTWDALFAGRDSCPVVLPDDYRPMIEQVYDGAEAMDDPKALRYQQKDAEMRRTARQFLSPDVTSTDAITEVNDRTFAEEDSSSARGQIAKTRLGDRISLVPVYLRNGSLSLDIHGTQPLSHDMPPPIQNKYGMLQADILARAIPVSDPRIIAAYRDEHRNPTMRWGWKEIPTLLLSVQPLLLDDQHQAVIDGRRLTLSKTLGLIIEKEEV